MKVLVAFIGCLWLHGATAQVSQPLRSISYNIHHASPPSGPATIDLHSITGRLNRYPADLIALQEADVNTVRCGKVDEAALIAKGLGMYVHFAKAIDCDGGSYGGALLSGYPLPDAQMIRLPMGSSVQGGAKVGGSGDSCRFKSGNTVLPPFHACRQAGCLLPIANWHKAYLPAPACSSSASITPKASSWTAENF